MKSYGIINMNRVDFIFQGTYLHNELKDYILSLNGVDEVYIDNELAYTYSDADVLAKFTASGVGVRSSANSTKLYRNNCPL